MKLNTIFILPFTFNALQAATASTNSITNAPTTTATPVSTKIQNVKRTAASQVKKATVAGKDLYKNHKKAVLGTGLGVGALGIVGVSAKVYRGKHTASTKTLPGNSQQRADAKETLKELNVTIVKL